MKKSTLTRLTIINKAFELIYTNGYRSTSVDDIIRNTQVTKGAFYYHFKSKDEMGIAIINEVLEPKLSTKFIKLIETEESPLNSIYTLFYHLLMKDEFLKIEYGCPASNLIQEMSPLNTSFSQALNKLTKQWLNLLTAAIEKGQKRNMINAKIDAGSSAIFIMSGYWGARNFGKLEKSDKPYICYLEQLDLYLKTLI